MFVRTMKWMVLAGAVCGAVACGGTQTEPDLVGSRNQGVGESCGGFAGTACPKGLVCVDDPSDSCDPNNGGRDCIGICQEETPQGVGQACGGFAGTACPKGLVCVDDPSDSCDPNNGGRDCIGICQEDTKPTPDNSNRYYVSHDPNECAVIRFVCPPPGSANADKTQYFGDSSGCGCETPR
jgi:hypothetical protein